MLNCLVLHHMLVSKCPVGSESQTSWQAVTWASKKPACMKPSRIAAVEGQVDCMTFEANCSIVTQLARLGWKKWADPDELGWSRWKTGVQKRLLASSAEVIHAAADSERARDGVKSLSRPACTIWNILVHIPDTVLQPASHRPKRQWLNLMLQSITDSSPVRF